VRVFVAIWVALFVGVGSYQPIYAPTTTVWQIGPPLSQGSKPQCVAYAMYAYLLYGPITVTPPSTDEIYQGATQLDGIDDSIPGTTVWAATEYLQRQGKLGELRTTDSTAQAIEWLKDGPLLLQLDWHASLYQFHDGYIESNKLPGESFKGHAILVYGYDAPTDTFFILNSWGEWGNHGTAKITHAEMREIVAEIWGWSIFFQPLKLRIWFSSGGPIAQVL
jgi:hypothetical protein